MRVVHVVPSVAIRAGGSAIGVAEASAALTQAGVKSVVYSTDLPGAATSPDRRPVRTDELAEALSRTDYRLFRTRPPRRWVFSPALARGLREEVSRADVVHVHLLHLYPTLAACRVARAASAPYVVAPCGSLDRAFRDHSRTIKLATDRLWQRKALNEAAALHYKTEQERIEAADYGLAPTGWVIPNGIRLSEARDRSPNMNADSTVLFLGRITYKKRVDLLLEAFRDVHREIPRARLIVAGPDDEALLPKLEQLSRRLGVDRAVTFAGQVQGRQKRSLLDQADAFVLPSTSENFGIGVVEALAAGLPTVATPGVAIAREAAAEGAVLLAGDSADGVANGLLAVLRNRDVRDELAQRGRRFAERYTWHAVVPHLTEMYEWAIRNAAS